MGILSRILWGEQRYTALPLFSFHIETSSERHTQIPNNENSRITYFRPIRIILVFYDLFLDDER